VKKQDLEKENQETASFGPWICVDPPWSVNQPTEGMPECENLKPALSISWMEKMQWPLNSPPKLAKCRTKVQEHIQRIWDCVQGQRPRQEDKKPESETIEALQKLSLPML